jgi:hypothetical protein
LKNVVIPNAALFSYLVTFGEILVGLALILVLFAGIAAFFGGFMNASYIFAGVAGANPLPLLRSCNPCMARLRAIASFGGSIGPSGSQFACGSRHPGEVPVALPGENGVDLAGVRAGGPRPVSGRARRLPRRSRSRELRKRA